MYQGMTQESSQTTTGLLSRKAMLAKLSISQWSARKLDKKITKETNDRYHAAEDAGRYNKCLIAQEHLQAIQKIANKARTFHEENTLPWEDKGFRILPADNYLTYTAEFRKIKAEFEAEIHRFIEVYPELVEEAKLRLNGMFDPADYPHPAEIEGKFAFTFAAMPIPDKDDFRVDLQQNEVDKIRQEIEARMDEAQVAAMQDLWMRVHEAVSRMAERLQDDDDGKPKKFKNSLVGNVQDLVDLLPRLNITNDDRLEQMRREIERKLAVYPADALRHNEAAREVTAKHAQDILDTMSGYC